MQRFVLVQCVFVVVEITFKTSGLKNKVLFWNQCRNKGTETLTLYLDIWNGTQPYQAGLCTSRGRPAYLLPDGLTKVRSAWMPHVFIPLQANVF